MKRIILMALAAVLLAAGCGSAEYDLRHGSADTPEGKTIVVSVFASDENYAWDFDTEADRETRDNYLRYMGIATQYLTDTAEAYGKKSEYIYDFEQNSDLYYETSFETDTTTPNAVDAEECMNRFLDEHVDSDALRAKYGADNVIYFMIVNTDEQSRAITCTRNYFEGMEYPYEIVFLYNVDGGTVNCPAVYAHEMMHTFGVPDLYASGDAYGITQEVVDYVQANMPDDLMYSCSDPETGAYLYDRIENEVSELDAYFAGLTDYNSLADKFDLIYNDHLEDD